MFEQLQKTCEIYTFGKTFSMDIEHLLQRASDLDGGKGLHERKAARNSRSKEIATEIGEVAREKGLAGAAEEFAISETAAAKYLARILKKDSSLTVEMLMDASKASDIEAFIYAGNTTSIKKLVTAAAGRFSEAEIRIVKAEIERRGADYCDF